FFQAEDGIRDFHVTGVQTCALPISIGLALYALCVWPANVNHMLMDLAAPDGGWGLAYHGPRMLAQPLVIWLALWCGDVTDWPFRDRKSVVEGEIHDHSGHMLRQRQT